MWKSRRDGRQLVTPTLVIREGGAGSETVNYLPMVLVKCCHASGSRIADGLYDTARATALAQSNLPTSGSNGLMRMSQDEVGEQVHVARSTDPGE